MSQSSKAFGKMPDHNVSRAFTARSDSLTESAVKEDLTSAGPAYQAGAGVATNRLKYENKPMPVPRTNTPSSTYSQPSPVNPIQPMRIVQEKPTPPTPKLSPFDKFAARIDKYTQFKSTSPFSALGKKRAVTDPLTPKRSSSMKEPSTSQPHKIEQNPSHDDNMSNVYISTHEELQTRARYQIHDNNHKELPVVPHPYKSPSGSLGQKVEDEPAQLTSFAFNASEKRTLPRPSQVTEPLLRNAFLPHTEDLDEDNVLGNIKPKPKQSIVLTEGRVIGSRTGGFGTVGEGKLVVGNEKQRVASQFGVIENINSPGARNPKERIMQNERAGLDPNGFLPSTVYTPKAHGALKEPNYQGMPLLPSSPAPLVRLQHPGMEDYAPLESPATVSSSPAASEILRDHDIDEAYLPTDPPSAHSMATLNPYSGGNSFTSESMPPEMAVPPLFAGKNRNNAVPPPPAQSFPEFRSSAPMPIELAELELKLHHHIASSSVGLSKLVTDKSDRGVDQLMRRLDSMDVDSKAGFKEMRQEFAILMKVSMDLWKEVVDLRKKVGELSEAHKEVSKSSDGLEKPMTEIQLRMRKLEDHIQWNAAGKVESMTHQQDQNVYGQNQSKLGAGANKDRVVQPQSYISNPSYGDPTKISPGGEQNQTRARGTELEIRGIPSPKKVHFIEQNLSSRQAPDIRDHPAYQSSHNAYSSQYGQDTKSTLPGKRAIPVHQPSRDVESMLPVDRAIEVPSNQLGKDGRNRSPRHEAVEAPLYPLPQAVRSISPTHEAGNTPIHEQPSHARDGWFKGGLRR